MRDPGGVPSVEEDGVIEADNHSSMFRLEILAAESLGARGLCCKVTAGKRRILIDPGIALGYRRHGLYPHPFQVAVGVTLRRKILAALREATEVVFSHAHGDHLPLADANPFQLALDDALDGLRGKPIWGPDVSDLEGTMRERLEAISRAANTPVLAANGRKAGILSFSQPMPHGEPESHLGTVIMTRIEVGDTVFVHASDIQLLGRDAIDRIISWSPTVVLVGGPPLYLAQLSGEARSEAWRNALCLASHVPTLIVDHHLLRSVEGIRWLDALAAESPNQVVCAADSMNTPRRMLEAWRRRLYRELPVPEGWHREYALGKADTSRFEVWDGLDASVV